MQAQREKGNVQIIKIIETAKINPEAKPLHTDSSSFAPTPLLLALLLGGYFAS